MVDAFVQGMQAVPSRINPQSLNPISFNLLRELRQEFFQSKSTGGFVAEKFSAALQEVYRTQQDKFLAVMVELVTVTFLAARDARLGIEPVFRLVYLGAAEAMIMLGFPADRIQRMFEQIMMAMFMSPVYDYTFALYQRLVELTMYTLGEFVFLQRMVSAFKPEYYTAMKNGFEEGLLNCYEVIDVDAVKKEDLKAMATRPYLMYYGLLYVVRDIWWFKPPVWYTKLCEMIDKVAVKKRGA